MLVAVFHRPLVSASLKSLIGNLLLLRTLRARVRVSLSGVLRSLVFLSGVSLLEQLRISWRIELWLLFQLLWLGLTCVVWQLLLLWRGVAHVASIWLPALLFLSSVVSGLELIVRFVGS